uniref:Serine proteinase inhibitor 3 n=1 Tax=Clonorchis sinensis TaxID=79923 RepID=A0A059VDA6_CLOSI|nr:serine proteinase inhibitor 3 [Clonorchis sinensis]
MESEMDFYAGLVQFSSDMYGQVVTAQSMVQQNVFISPLSVYVALLMALVGAGGQSRLELRQSMRIPSELEEATLHNVLGSTLRKISMGSKDVTTSLANRLFVLQSMNIRDEFKDTLKKNYGAETELLVDYADLEAKRQKINQWVSEQTNSKIPELLSHGVLQQNSLMAIVNTVYFKGFWKLQFDKQMTMNGLFYRMQNSAAEIPMMTMCSDLPYQDLPEIDAEAVKLPFRDSVWEVLIVLPNKNDGLPNLMSQFRNSDTMRKILAKPFYPVEVDLKLPRFKLSELPPLDMKTMLQLMGVKSIFDQTANFSNLSPDPNIYVSDLVHKAVIEVDEEGAEAAAGTGLIISLTAARNKMQFLVDHPFLMALIYNSTVPAFIGHVFEPEVL